MKDLRKYFSKTVLKISPYQWEEIPNGSVLRFDTNTLPFPPPSMNVFLQDMVGNCPINEYADPSYKKLKKMIADYEKVSVDRITITNSGDEAIDILAKTFLDQGDYFITTPPTYEMFEIQCGINRGKNLEIPLEGPNFVVNAEKINQASKNKLAKLIYLVNPNNPTASIIPQETIEEIVKNSDVIIVVDEVYREFYGKTVISLLRKYKNLVILRSFSKFAALAGTRIGYLIANKQLSEKFEAIRFPMGVSFLSYKLAEFVLEKDRLWMKEQVLMIVSERKHLSEELTKLGLYVYPSYANFLLVKLGENASDICERLKQTGIIIRDQSKKKYLAGCVRITIRDKRQNNILIKNLKEVL